MNITLATLVRVADALGSPPGRLLQDIEAVAVTSAGGAGSDPPSTVRNPSFATPREPDALNSGTVSVDPEDDRDGACRAIGSHVASLRRARKWTQAELATRAACALQHLQRVEAGRQNVTVRVLVRLARALDVTVAELVGRV